MQSGGCAPVVAAILCALAAALCLAKATEAQRPPEAQRKLSVADLKADFAQLYDTLEKSHYDLFAKRSRAEYDELYRSMLAGFDRPLPVREAHARFQKFVAYGRVAHARTQGFMDAYAAHRAAGGKALPLGLRMVGGNTYVVETGGDSRIGPGDELLSLDGEPVKTWVDRLGAYVAADNDYMLHTLMEFDFPGLLWLRAGTREGFAATVRSGEKVFATRIPARSREEARTSGDRLDLDWNKREWRMMADRIAWLRPGPFYDNAPGSKNMWDVRSFADFIDGAFRDIVAANARAVVIDLRNNAGGDNSFSDLLVSWFANRPYRFVSDFRIRVSEAAIAANEKRLRTSRDAPDPTSPKLAAAYRGRKPGEVIEFETPFACPRKGKRFGGAVLLLVNRHSYSNTVMVAALAQDFGFATVAGEETSDLSTTYGAMEQFELSRTRIAVGFPKAYIVRPSGATDPRGVVPDVAIATPIVEGKDDPVLQHALRLAAAPNERRPMRRPALSAKVAQALASASPCRD